MFFHLENWMIPLGFHSQIPSVYYQGFCEQQVWQTWWHCDNVPLHAFADLTTEWRATARVKVSSGCPFIDIEPLDNETQSHQLTENDKTDGREDSEPWPSRKRNKERTADESKKAVLNDTGNGHKAGRIHPKSWWLQEWIFEATATKTTGSAKWTITSISNCSFLFYRT